MFVINGGNGIIVIPGALREQFDAAWANGRVIFFSAPCGTGKTVTAERLTADKKTFFIDCEALDRLPEDIPDDIEVVLVDNFQMVHGEEANKTVISWLRKYKKPHFIFLSRGVLPGWLMSWQLTGLLATIEYSDLLMDKNDTAEFFNGVGISITNEELRDVMRDTKGYGVAVHLIAQMMAKGASYTVELREEMIVKLFHYFEDSVYHRFEPRQRHLLISLSPFESFDAELAKLVSGDGRVGELLSELLHETTMFARGSAEQYRFRPIFRRFLMWELTQDCTVEQRDEIYRRAGLYYEMRDDYGNALQCYSKCGDHHRVSELLMKNGRAHPGSMHYYEMERYYYALPKEVILRSPELMSAMSMLTALSMDMESSDMWYKSLRDYAATLDKTDAEYKLAMERLFFLDISLPQRGSEGIIDLIGKAFRIITKRAVKLPEFSVTSTLPSLMNGGKDFCSWSKKDDFLYATMRKAVETVLGRDGVALADCAICESKFEKGEDISERALNIMMRMPEIQRKGTPDTEFVAMGLVIRFRISTGSAREALSMLEMLRESFEEKGLTRFFPNMDAMRCRIWLRLSMTDEAYRWLKVEAPAYVPKYRVLWRYRYMTAAMVQLAEGHAEQALPYVALYLPYCEACHRTMDTIYIRVIMAICHFRLKNNIWCEELTKALDMAREYDFVVPIAQFGSAILPLLTRFEGYDDKKANEWFRRVLTATRKQALNYPDFLKPPAALKAPLSPAEQRVLRLLCYNRSNREIADILGVKLPTVKTQVRSILQKLNISRRTEVKEIAVAAGLFDTEDAQVSY